MPFVFSRFFYLLILLGLVPLSLSWGRPWLRWATLAYDLLLISLAIIDGRRSTLPKGIQITESLPVVLPWAQKPTCKSNCKMPARGQLLYALKMSTRHR